MQTMVVIELVEKPRRDIQCLYVLYEHGPMTAKEIWQKIRETYNEKGDEKNQLDAIRYTLRKLRMTGHVKVIGLRGNAMIYAITDKGLKLLRYEGLI